ncbi:putative membrane-associated protein [Xenococcus sp. PCC 7305]|uniref:DedA family protein n=1 Tax=Xenococcus sp. PCC 7305 TaxID=102125 RepID=UPI0002ACB41A|nr:DedA family protein [Xenococcus sp. PCC 7305]ELS02016.1 putative membrane-associated protein [Xenococcus sp. PCC 7305]
MSLELLSLENTQEIARQYGYWAVFIGIALENTGIPIPGETITIVGGFLAGSRELSFWGVLLSAIAGAVIGDNFGYWIGKIGGWQFLIQISKVFRIPEDKLELARDKYSKNAAQAVFWGRFVTLLRIFAGPLAGITNMPYRKFLIYNFGGATIWALIIVSLSYFLGQIVSLEQIIGWITQAGILIFLIIIALFTLPVIVNYSRQKLVAKE